MRLAIKREIPEDENCGLRREWNLLVQQMEYPEIFYTYEWALAVSRAFKAAMTPWLFLAYEGDSLIGVAAFATDAQNQTAFFLASTTADYCDFVCKPDHRPEFVSAVLAELRKHDCPKVVFANLPADSTTIAVLRNSRSAGYSAFVRPGYLCANIAISSEDQRKGVSQSAQRRLHRFQKAVKQNGEVRVRHSKTSEEIAGVLYEFSRAHVARFLASGRISNLARAARRDFLVELSNRLSVSGWVVLSRLMLAERPIAWNFGFQFGGGYFWYQPTFDIDFHQYSPGVWLLTAIVEEACESREINKVDLGLGSEGYKERLANSSRQTLHITASRFPFAHLSGMLKYRAANVVKSLPRVEESIRAAITLASSAQARVQNEGMAKCLARCWGQVSAAIFSTPRTVFLEWAGDGRSSLKSTMAITANIAPIDLNLLAEAAMHYESDSKTLEYLLRAAKLLAAKTTGFALVDGARLALYFCWVTDFDPSSVRQSDYPSIGLHSGCALISASWTPLSARDKGYEKVAILSLASRLRAAGKRPWMVISRGDVTRGREMEEAGFVPRFSSASEPSLDHEAADASRAAKSARSQPVISTAA